MIESTQRCVVDEIITTAEGERIAVLVADAGGTVTIPMRLLPEGVRVNDVLDFTLSPIPEETERRRTHVRSLQQRLFGSRKLREEG